MRGGRIACGDPHDWPDHRTGISGGLQRRLLHFRRFANGEIAKAWKLYPRILHADATVELMDGHSGVLRALLLDQALEWLIDDGVIKQE